MVTKDDFIGLTKKESFFQRAQPCTSISATDELSELSANPEDAGDYTSSVFSNHWHVYMDQALSDTGYKAGRA